MSKSNVYDALTALKRIDTNLEMFNRLPSSAAVEQSIASLNECKQQLFQYARGEIDYDALTYESKMWIFQMPSWGYKGT